MSNGLYNKELVINDAIIAAHPHGGTTIVDIKSPSGGEGRALDIIERQALTIKRLIQPEKIIHRLAALSEELESLGHSELSFKVIKLAEDEANSQENDDILQQYKSSVILEMREIINFVNDAVKYINNIPDVNIDSIKDVEKTSKRIKNALVILANDVNTEKEAQDIVSKFYRECEKLLAIFKDLKVGNQSEWYNFLSPFAVIHNNLYRNTIDKDIVIYKKYHADYKKIVDNFKVRLNSFEKRVAAPTKIGLRAAIMQMNRTELQSSSTYLSKILSDSSEAEEMDPSVVEEMQEVDTGSSRQPPDTDMSNQKNPYVVRIQQLIKVEPTGVYNQATHDALSEYLVNHGGLLEDFYRKQLSDKNYTEITAEMAQFIYDVLSGKVDPTVRETVVEEKQKIKYIDFASPTGSVVNDFPIGTVIAETKQNSFALLKRLQQYGAIKGSNEFATEEENSAYLKEIILRQGFLESIVQSMHDSLKEKGFDARLLPVFKEIMHDAINDLRETTKKEVSKGEEKVYVLHYLDDIAPRLAAAIASSDIAVKEYVGMLAGHKVTDKNGYISERRALSEKATILNVAHNLIKRYNLVGTKAVDRTKAKHPSAAQQKEALNLFELIVDESIDEILSAPDPESKIVEKAQSAKVLKHLDSIGYDTRNGNIKFQNYLRYILKNQLQAKNKTKKEEPISL